MSFCKYNSYVTVLRQNGLTNELDIFVLLLFSEWSKL